MRRRVHASSVACSFPRGRHGQRDTVARRRGNLAWVLGRDASVAVVCVQEHRLTAARAAVVAKRLAWAGWRSHWDAGEYVDGTLAGTAVLWRQHLFVTPVALPRILRGRACAIALRAKGVDLCILALYMRYGQEVRGNTDVIVEVGCALAPFHAFIALGDWN